MTGRIVAAAEAKGVPLDKLPLADMQAVEPRITKPCFPVLSVQNSVESRTSYGGTAPQNVRKMARAWLKRLEKAAGKGLERPAEALERQAVSEADWCCGL